MKSNHKASNRNSMYDQNYKAFIFDFGGVLYNISPKESIYRFFELSVDRRIRDKFNKEDFVNSSVFMDFEKGKISSDDFRNFLRIEFLIDAEDNELDEAWNATLLGIRSEAIPMLKQLKKDSSSQLILLSNTNAIHYSSFAKECVELFAIFDKLYFSFLVGKRKPEQEIYVMLLEDNGLNAEDVLFIDDLEENTAAAGRLGINTYVMKPTHTLSKFLHSVSNLQHKADNEE